MKKRALLIITIAVFTATTIALALTVIHQKKDKIDLMVEALLEGEAQYGECYYEDPGGFWVTSYACTKFPGYKGVIGPCMQPYRFKGAVKGHCY